MRKSKRELFNVPASQAAEYISAKLGAPVVSPSTFGRWANKGFRDQDGNRVRIRTRRLGGRVFTSFKALDEAIEIMNATSADSDSELISEGC